MNIEKPVIVVSECGGNSGTVRLVAEKLAANGVNVILTLERRSDLPFVMPTMIGPSKKDRRDQDKQHWKAASRNGKNR